MPSGNIRVALFLYISILFAILESGNIDENAGTEVSQKLAGMLQTTNEVQDIGLDWVIIIFSLNDSLSSADLLLADFQLKICRNLAVSHFFTSFSQMSPYCHNF